MESSSFKFRLNPSPSEIPQNEGFTVERDLFGRAHFGQKLTNLLQAVTDPQVIALDAPWGSGKSTFLQMWQGELRKAGFPVIVFDAFENDYISDAFSAMLRELVALSEEHGQKKASETLKKRGVEMGAQLLRSGLEVTSKAAVRLATAGAVDPEDIADAARKMGQSAQDPMLAYVKEVTKNIQKQKKTINLFKTILSELSGTIKGNNKHLPIIFIIDELDRCKPIFALDIIEKLNISCLQKMYISYSA